MRLFKYEKSKSVLVFLAVTLLILLWSNQSGSITLAPAISFMVLFGIPLYFMKPMPIFASGGDRLARYLFVAACSFIFIFLIAPILIIVPLSFNVEPYFTFTTGMLNFEASAYSLRWYEDIVRNGMMAPDAVTGWWSDMWNNAQWIRSARNSFFIATIAAFIATTLGTIAALGLSRPEMPYRALITSLLISPMIVPL